MKWQLIVIPEARSDFAAAAKWYNAQRQELGIEFVDEVHRTISDILAAPLSHRVQNKSKNLRWAITDRFPYRVVNQVVDAMSQIRIVAVCHSARNNRSWRQRV
jgi:plasmid stabilization system protein ParE